MIELEIKAFLGNKESKDEGKEKTACCGSYEMVINKKELIEKLKELGFAFDYACDEADCYYQAPDRDFRKTDEALRIRTCGGSGESRALVTYKGPKQDSESHTRKEIETEIPDAAAATELFKSLGYKPVLTVSKHREVYTLTDKAACAEYAKKDVSNSRRGTLDGEISVCLDDVAGLGFAVEIEKLIDDSRFGNAAGRGNRAQDETLAPKSDLEKEKAAAREELLSLLDKLGIPRSALTMKTYLEMLLEKSKR